MGWLFACSPAMAAPACVARADEDRAPWLAAIAAYIVSVLAMPGGRAVVTCSALKRRYRDVLFGGCSGVARPGVSALPDAPAAAAVVAPAAPCVCPVFLHADARTLEARLLARHGHFMRAGMLASQLGALELPREGEALCIDVGAAGPEEAVRRVLDEYGLGDRPE